MVEYRRMLVSLNATVSARIIEARSIVKISFVFMVSLELGFL